MRRAIVTAADDNHFPLVEGLLGTLDLTKHPDVFLLDGGLTEAQRDMLRARGVTVVPVGWDIPVETTELWLRTLVARPFIPDHIPGYDVYVWIDADAWIQDPVALPDFVDASMQEGFAASSAVHRGYRQYVTTAPNMPGVPLVVYYGWLYQSLLDKLGAALIASAAVLNGGVWAASSAKGMFQRWQAAARSCYARAQAEPLKYPSSWRTDLQLDSDPLWPGGKHLILFHADEVSMNLAARSGDIGPAVMSARHNWLCSGAIPMQNSAGQFVDTAWPHDPILIVHQTGQTKSGTWPARQVGGGRKLVSLRAPMVQMAT